MIPHTLADIRTKDIDLGDRFRKDYRNLDELAASIQDKGVIHPIAIMEQGEGKPFLLLAGGRRYAATVVAGILTIPCKIYPLLDDLTRRQIELIENILREELNYAEDVAIKAEIHRLEIEKYGQAGAGPSTGKASIASTAELLGKSRSLIQQDIELANAINERPDLGLGDKKNKTEALRALQRAKSDMIKAEMAERLQNRQAQTTAEMEKRRIMNSYIVGDFFDGIATVPDGSFNLVEIDPPYAIDLKHQKQQRYEDGTVDYNEVDADDYPEFLRRALVQAHRVMTDNSWLLIWFGPEPWWDLVIRLLRSTGFEVKGIPAIWSKVESSYQTNHPERYMGNAWEPFFYASKGHPVLNHQGQGNVFQFPTISSNEKTHPTERPIEMMMRILDIFAPIGSRVLVPFAGSGNTLLAASNLNMPAMGYDLQKLYKDRFVVRVAMQEPEMYRSYK